MTARVPLRWPAGWAGPAALDLLKGTPFNCVIAGQRAGALRGPAAKSGITVLETPPADVTVIDGAWPGMRITQGRRRDTADAGPTGAPWIDSNGWAVKLARARFAKPVWAAFDPAADAGAATADRYQLAVADVAMAGGQWIVSLDHATAAALERREAAAVEAWRKLAGLAAFFEQRAAWREWAPLASLAVISDFTGDNEFMATEVLNLAARRNLLYRIVEKGRAAPADLAGLPAALYVDQQAPSAALLDILARFARGGGLVIAPAAVAAKFPAGPPAECALEDYNLRTLGKGRLAAPKKEWDDPFVLAADAHILTSRRHDPVRVYNSTSLFVNCIARGPEAVVHLLNFARRESADRVSVGITRKYAAARLRTPGAEAVPVKPAPAGGGGVELYLPPLGLYAALELGSAK